MSTACEPIPIMTDVSLVKHIVLGVIYLCQRDYLRV